MQRVGPLGRMPELIAELGLDPAPVFRGLSFGPESLAAPDARLPFSEAMLSLDRAARLSGRADFGLLLGLRNDHRCLGVVGELMACGATLGEALADAAAAQAENSSGASAYLIAMGDWVAFGYGIYDRSVVGADQAYAVAMGAMGNMVRALSGGAAAPAEVHFACRAPAEAGLYDRRLGARVRFNEFQTCLMLPQAALAARNPGADPDRRARVLAGIADRLRLGPRTATDRLRHVLRAALCLGAADLASVAARLDLSARSLDRHLADEGTSFRAELDAIRHSVARELLFLTDLPVGDISAAVAYANPAAFTRGFRRWSGVSPSQWRDEMRREPEWRT